MLPGILESLEALGRLPDLAVGLGTGNVETGARIKLERARLNAHLPFGGFGCVIPRSEPSCCGSGRSAALRAWGAGWTSAGSS